MTPLSILERAMAEFGDRATLVLRPSASDQELDRLRKRLKGALPDDVVSLLRRTTGFEFAPLATDVDFLGCDAFEVEGAFPNALPLLGDGAGNYWIIDVIPGEWGAVFYVCHDPAAVVVQAVSLSQFLEQVFALGRPGHPKALDSVRGDVLRRIARKNPYLVERSECLRSSDQVIADFAAHLPDDFKVADLRTRELGIGFSFDANAAIRRAGDSLIFGVEA
jgi:SMI1 / KNR4 family (SUKH-1)